MRSNLINNHTGKIASKRLIFDCIANFRSRKDVKYAKNLFQIILKIFCNDAVAAAFVHFCGVEDFVVRVSFAHF